MKMRTVSLLTLALVASGCSIVPGKSDYACPAPTSGVNCKTPIEIYRMTDKVDNLENQKVITDIAMKERAGKGSATGATLPMGTLGGGADGNGVLLASPNNPMPLLEPAQVLRIWVSPYADEMQDLHWPGYVFTEITPRRWSFGEAGVPQQQALVPVQMVRPTQNAASQGQSLEQEAAAAIQQSGMPSAGMMPPVSSNRPSAMPGMQPQADQSAQYSDDNY